MPVLLTASGCVVIDEVVALVLQIMSEMQVRCGEPASPLSLVLLKEMEQVVSVGDEVDEVGALAPNLRCNCWVRLCHVNNWRRLSLSC